MTEPQAPAPLAKVPSLPRVLACAAVIVAVDAYVLGQGLLVMLVLPWMLFVALPLTLRKKYAGVRPQRLRNIGVYLGAVVLTAALIFANISMAERRAETVIAALTAFKEQNRRYPDRLDELVPAFLPAIPAARYTLTSPNFHYRLRDDRATLIYSVVVPYGARVYDFEKGKWFETD